MRTTSCDIGWMVHFPPLNNGVLYIYLGFGLSTVGVLYLYERHVLSDFGAAGILYLSGSLLMHQVLV